MPAGACTLSALSTFSSRVSSDPYDTPLIFLGYLANGSDYLFYDSETHVLPVGLDATFNERFASQKDPVVPTQSIFSDPGRAAFRGEDVGIA